MSQSPDTPSGATATRGNFRQWIIPSLKHCWYLTGPTGSGKSSLAVDIARQVNAEIISLDSMAIYRGMDIGTAKPTSQLRAQVTHHQIDIVDPNQTYSVSNYVTSTHAVVEQIRSRGKNVLICGGTPLYLKSLLRGLFLGPAADWEFRESIEADIQRFGQQVLRDRLSSVDPILAHKLHPNDRRRMIRALEVARVTGMPLSHWQEQFETPAAIAECPSLVLRLERGWLHERINQRVERMLQVGLEAEVVGLLERFGSLSRTASQAVGYREVLERLQQGISLADTTERIRAHTRQFARRQEIWFRGLSELQPLVVTPEVATEELVQQAVAFFERYPQRPAVPSPPRGN